jgi:hypothetical protein
MKEFGFVVEDRGVTPAIRANEEVVAHDLSGFLGRWRSEGVFFPSESAEILCNVALKKATTYWEENFKID